MRLARDGKVCDFQGKGVAIDEQKQWSDGLRAQTRRALEEMDVMSVRDTGLAMKHSGNEGFATISLDDMCAGRLRLVNRKTKVACEFASVDEVLAAGWAVD